MVRGGQLPFFPGLRDIGDGYISNHSWRAFGRLSGCIDLCDGRSELRGDVLEDLHTDGRHGFFLRDIPRPFHTLSGKTILVGVSRMYRGLCDVHAVH